MPGSLPCAEADEMFRILIAVAAILDPETHSQLIQRTHAALEAYLDAKEKAAPDRRH